jgi:hypothetical protein
MLKKVKSAQMSACPNLSVCRVFPPNQKHDRSADRQMTDLIFRDTLIPDDLLFRASNNLLEFLAAIMTLWVDIINGCLSSGDCALSMTNSTMAEGWMRKSNFSKYGVDPVQARTQVNAARKYAEIFMIADVKSYSQWFLGKRNNVRTLSLGSGKGLTMNSPKFFAPFSQIKCQTVSRYYHSPARSAPG